ncbi:MAG: ABC transporter ATP-binding protein [Oscillospiraceae bacterium]
METVLKIEHLVKYMGKKKIIDDVSFETYAGEVFGFLGPNGAGKTTTIKMVMGLLDIDDGVITVSGINVVKKFEKAMDNISGIVENPEMYPYLTARKNLELFARMRPNVTPERIKEVIKLVGLEQRVDDKIKKYSLGMKQRIGLAQALLSKPKLIILDEPTNGLDPAGIKELRDILKDLAHKDNICVVVSSHLMSEMELMCDRVGIIAKGKMLDVKTIEALTETVNANGLSSYHINVNDVKKATGILQNFEDVKIGYQGEDYMEISLIKEKVPSVIKALVLADVDIFSCAAVDTKKLEDVFIELTNSGGAQIG